MKKKDKKKAIILGGLGVLAFASIFLLYCHWCNNALEINQFTVKSEKLPDSFIGFRIAQISDLHNTEFGEDNKKLLSMLKKAAPDIIAITGDSVDASHTDIDITLDFVRKAVGIAPCYYVTGNHEASISDYQTLEDGLKTAGVYDSGLYKSPSTNMIVSRGLGNSTFPFRINNRPEILLIELSS